jgi:peroxiredoxin
LPARDFTLPDSAGKPFRLSDYRGKRVLLAFWNWATPFSLDGLSSLQTIQVRNPDRLAVFGICVPPAPSCAEEDEHSHEHAHHHHAESAGTGTGAEHMRCFVQDAATRLKLNYSMLMDATGEIGLRFKVEDLPVYVLIDADGTIRRRFVGIRTESALAAVVEEVVTPSAVRASANFN